MRLTPAQNADILRRLAAGQHHQEVADAVGCSLATVYGRARQMQAKPPKRKPAKHRAPKPSNPDALPDIDFDGPAVDIARQLLDHTTKTIAKLTADSPRLNPARAEARALVKLINSLEREQAARETPEEEARRLRREDRETERRILQYVEQHEKAAKPTAEAPFGRCVHCGGALTEQQALELYGDDR